MTAAGEYRTTTCSAHGHPEFTVRFAREVPVPGLERMILGYFEDAVARGTSFKPGQTVQLGWATLRLTQRDDGTLGVLEPDLREELRWSESVDQSLLETWRQKEVLSSLELLERADYPRQAQQAIVCANVWSSPAFLLGRTEPSSPSDSGWFVGCTDESHDHQHPEALTVVPLIEIAVRAPALAQFFALPVGTDVLVSGAGSLQTRVFVDDEERNPRAGSYLAALARQG
ncbi:MAG: immunity protein Imm33 domain-containing protein [Myxococcota bacterium]